MSFVDGSTLLLLLAGAFFFLAGTLGVLRFPDPLCRLHAVTKADNLGLGFIVLGLMLRSGSVLAAAKLLLVWLLVLLASATSSYLIARWTVENGPGAGEHPG